MTSNSYADLDWESDTGSLDISEGSWKDVSQRFFWRSKRSLDGSSSSVFSKSSSGKLSSSSRLGASTRLLSGLMFSMGGSKSGYSESLTTEDVSESSLEDDLFNDTSFSAQTSRSSRGQSQPEQPMPSISHVRVREEGDRRQRKASGKSRTKTKQSTARDQLKPKLAITASMRHKTLNAADSSRRRRQSMRKARSRSNIPSSLPSLIRPSAIDSEIIPRSRGSTAVLEGASSQDESPPRRPRPKRAESSRAIHRSGAMNVSSTGERKRASSSKSSATILGEVSMEGKSSRRRRLPRRTVSSQAVLRCGDMRDSSAGVRQRLSSSRRSMAACEDFSSKDQRRRLSRKAVSSRALGSDDNMVSSRTGRRQKVSGLAASSDDDMLASSTGRRQKASRRSKSSAASARRRSGRRGGQVGKSLASREHSGQDPSRHGRRQAINHKRLPSAA